MLRSHRLEIVQNCYVVSDLEQACARLRRVYGLGPFIGGGSGGMLDNHFYRGVSQPPIRLRGVFVQSGEMNIELVQILSPGPSAFHDMFEAGAEGFHHVAMFCDDYQATRDGMVAEGWPVASEFTTGFGAMICYIDARSALGHMIELYPEDATIRSMYAQTREAVYDWDGETLIIPWK